MASKKPESDSSKPDISSQIKPVQSVTNLETDPGHCYHCGETIEERHTLPSENSTESSSDNQLHFCCRGCVQVYQIITASGNQSYYTYRTEFANRPEEDHTANMPYEVWESEITEDDEGIRTTDFLIQGIHCASCVWLNERILKDMPGVVYASVQLATNRARVSWNTQTTSMREIARAVADIGYTLVPVQKTSEKEARRHSRDMLKRMTVAAFFTGNIMLVSIALYAGYFGFMDKGTKNFFHFVSWLMATPVLVYSAAPFFRNAWGAIKNRFLSMDILTATGISLAYGYSVYVTLSQRGEVFFDSMCMVTAAILTGRFIETRFKERSLFFVENLGHSLPKTVHRLKKADKNKANRLPGYTQTKKLAEKNDPEESPVENTQIGDILVVYPGEVVPLDGLLLNDKAEVDESMVTGEFRSVEKKRKQRIMAGSRTLAVKLFLMVDSTAEDNTLTAIARLADESLRNMPQTQALAEKVSRWFIGFVLFAGSATFIWWTSISSTPSIEAAVLNTVTLLIAACPCALNLSIPTAFIVAIQRAFNAGIIVKGGQSLEDLAAARTLALDKTGTLTEGEMSIAEYLPLKKMNKTQVDKMLALAVAIEKEVNVSHPISRAFLKFAETQQLKNKPASGLKEAEYEPGLGITMKVGRKTYYLGSKKPFASIVTGPKDNRKPVTSVYLAEVSDGTYLPLIEFQLIDNLKQETSEVLSDIKKINRSMKHVLITGDSSENARFIGDKLKLDEIYAGATPEEKLRLIEKFKTLGNTAMIGDGVNDAAALAAADTGISFADAAEISATSSDVLLLGNDLSHLRNMFALAHDTRRKIRQNLIMSFFYNILLLPLAFMGAIIPLVGAAAMSLSSLVVVVNSMRIKIK